MAPIERTLKTGPWRQYQRIFDKTEAGVGVGILRSMGVRIVGGMLEVPDMQGALREAQRRMALIMTLSDSPKPSDELDERLISHFANRRASSNWSGPC